MEYALPDNRGSDSTATSPEDERYLIGTESSGLHFTMTTFEYLDAVVGDARNPIVVINRFNQFVTADGRETLKRLMEWAEARSALIVGVKWPRGACRRRSA